MLGWQFHKLRPVSLSMWYSVSPGVLELSARLPIPGISGRFLAGVVTQLTPLAWRDRQ